MHSLCFHIRQDRRLCVATIGAMRFSCVASVTHFLFGGRKMKRVISLLLSIVMTFGIVGAVDLSAYAEEDNDALFELVLTNDNIQYFKNYFLSDLDPTKQAFYIDHLTEMNHENDETHMKVVQDSVNRVQKTWKQVLEYMPETITDSQIVSMGNKAFSYLNGTVEIFKNIEYIVSEDERATQICYHGLQAVNTALSICGISLGPVSVVLKALERFFILADILLVAFNEEIVNGHINNYDLVLSIDYLAGQRLTTPTEHADTNGLQIILGEDLYNKWYEKASAMYLYASMKSIARNMENITVVESFYDYGYYGGHSYQIIKNTFSTFNAAEKYCEENGGHLAVIESEEEDIAVYNYLRNCGLSSAFLGMYEKEEGIWFDIFDNPLNYYNWAPGEPNNAGGKNEYIINYWKDYPDGQWNDTYIGEPYCNYFICEWDNYINSFPTMNDEHYYEQTVISPTCTTDGYTINRCTDCELEYYSNNVSKLGHNYKFSQTTLPTCTAQGYDLYTCIRCDSTEKRNIVSSLGHNYQYQNTVLPTCASQGYDTYKCSRCTVTEKRNTVSANGHKYSFTKTVEPTCTAQGYDLYNCSTCSATEKRNTVSSTGHNYEEISNTATCTEKGIKTTVCSKCGDTKTLEVSSLGHTYSKIYTTPTCTDAGGYTNTCSRCGDITYDTYDAKGHDYGDCVGKDYINKISRSTISTTPGYFDEFYHTSSSIGSTSQIAFSSTNIAVPNEVRLNINDIEKIVDYQFAVYGGLFSRKSCSGIFAYDKTTGRAPEQSAIPYTDKDGNLVNMKYVDFKVSGEWTNGEYTIEGNQIVDSSGTVVSTEFTDTRPHIVYTRNEAITNGILNSDGTVNVSLDIVEYQGVSFSAGIPGVYFSSGRITSSNLRRFIDVFAYDENANNSIESGKYDVDLCFYNTSNSGLVSTTFKICDNKVLQKQISENDYELTCFDCGEKHTETVDKSALIAAQDKFAEFSSEDYSKKSFEKLKKVCESYKYIENNYASQEKCDAAVTEILEAIYDLQPYLKFTVSAKNGSYEVTCDEKTSSDSKYSLLFGTEITLTATANEGYEFVGWYDVTNNLYFSKESTYTFKLTENTNLKAAFVKEQSATLTFTTYSNWVQSTVTKTIDEWNSITSIEDLLPEVPYRYGYSNGRWAYDNADVLSKLQTGENVFLIPEYDEDDTSLPTPRESADGVPALDLYYKLDADANVGSFVMAAGLPDDCRIESVGIAFYYKKANEFDPTKFELLNNNKMLVSRFNTDETEDIYIVNMNKFTSTYNWAARGYITYYDADGNLKNAYSNQVNIINREQV